MKWFRQTPIHNLNNKVIEEWIRVENKIECKYTVEVNLSKKTDLHNLKSDIIKEIKAKVNIYQKSRSEIFSGKLEKVENCPVCLEVSENSDIAGKVYNAVYYSCNNCSHVYLKQRPSSDSISNFYKNDKNYSLTYTNKEKAEFRLKNIDQVLLDYVLNIYKKEYNIAPKNILDVGSGGGHFIEACKRAGIDADGLEFSEESIKFAKETWGLELIQKDFKEYSRDSKSYDIVTFWGLLEHVHNPNEFIESARIVLSKSKFPMIICRVPRWLSLSTASQLFNHDKIIRHLDPVGHIMIYTDASLLELFYRNKYKPVSAWYYGMDIYETLMQVGHITGNYDHFSKTADFQNSLQYFLDISRLSDLLVLSTVPLY